MVKSVTVWLTWIYTDAKRKCCRMNTCSMHSMFQNVFCGFIYILHGFLLYTGLFLPSAFFESFHLQMFLPGLELAKTKLWIKKDSLSHSNEPSLKFNCRPRGRMGQKLNRVEQFPLYSINLDSDIKIQCATCIRNYYLWTFNYEAQLNNEIHKKVEFNRCWWNHSIWLTAFICQKFTPTGLYR